MNEDNAPLAQWRALVERDLRGASFERALVTKTPEGIPLQPLYTDSPARARGPIPAPEPTPARLCLRLDPDDARDPEGLDGLFDGVDALWIDGDDEASRALADAHAVEVIAELAAPSRLTAPLRARVVALDPLSAVARGALPPDALSGELAALARWAQARPDVARARVSTLAAHEAGADAADELAFALGGAATYLRAMCDHGVDLDLAATALTAQLAVGRDFFGELCKLRALRVCWHKLLAAAGARDTALWGLHAVCGARALSRHDPWVNMLRVTTEVAAAMLGGAALVTPVAYDHALATRSALGRRVARNTALVLREESHLARVSDPAAGSHYVEHRTEALAREAWSRFREIERGGGLAEALCRGALRERYGAAWSRRAEALATRREPVLGVSEFANLDEPLGAPPTPEPEPLPPALIPRRDAAGFEALREALAGRAPEVLLLTLGPAAEHRARLGFAQGFFALAGARCAASDAPRDAAVACVCGSDARYAEEAVGAVRALREAGCARVLLAGRPGALEAALREAGAAGFIHVGCDALATLRAALEVSR